MNRLLILIALFSFEALAEGKFITGIGYIAPGRYRVDNEISPLPLGLSIFPMIAYRGERLRVLGPNISYDLIKGAFSLSAQLNAMGDRYQSHDLEKRDTAINTGLTARLLFLTISHGVDISRTYNGRVSNIGLGWPFQVTDTIRITPQISKEYLSADYVNYYFGIKEGESDYFKTYSARSAGNDIYALGFSYALSEDSSLALNYTYKKFDVVISDSPTISDSSYGTWSIFWNRTL